jgi:hypothetical protein
MDLTKKYMSDDLLLVVWPKQNAAHVLAGEMTWAEAACEAWAIDASKADRVRILIAVHKGTIRGAWPVETVSHEETHPVPGSRRVNRSSFTLGEDTRLRYLLGTASPLGARRNPQAVVQLRDANGFGPVLADPLAVPETGAVSLAGFVLSVSPDGAALLTVPAGKEVSVRAA